jgi:hypothetical protein
MQTELMIAGSCVHGIMSNEVLEQARVLDTPGTPEFPRLLDGFSFPRANIADGGVVAVPGCTPSVLSWQSRLHIRTVPLSSP